MQEGGEDDFILPPPDYGLEPKLNFGYFLDVVEEDIGIPR